MKIRLIKDKDYSNVHDMIEKTCRITLAHYYPKKSIDKVVESLNVKGLKKRASFTHFYVVEDKDKIIGCGAIGPYWDSLTESSLFTIFVDPDYQGKGIGKQIIKTLENDEYFLRADRIEIPAGIAAIPFYKKMGYEHKNGVLNYEDGHFKMEKFNK